MNIQQYRRTGIASFSFWRQKLQKQKPKWRHRLGRREGMTSHGSCTHFLMVGWPSVLLLAVPRLCCPRRNCRLENDDVWGGVCLCGALLLVKATSTHTHPHSHTHARRVVTRSSRSADANGRRACHNCSTHHRHRAQDGRQVMRISPARARSVGDNLAKAFLVCCPTATPIRFRRHTPCSLLMAIMLAACTLAHSLAHPTTARLGIVDRHTDVPLQVLCSGGRDEVGSDRPRLSDRSVMPSCVHDCHPSLPSGHPSLR